MQIIDKDRSPRWSPPTLADVGAVLVTEFFAVPPRRRPHLDLDRGLARTRRKPAR
ncbi:hypothetical protein [Pseudofrankia sp. BMG5.37]|uniref:hypothetical protein n=1 Tax=Pseudofrankia sp. BMG5.37 TaxID=3050035 RepID=UPI001F5263A6|nr:MULTISPECIES: hypothetical protein [unclassified Pseudofrankia]MDT3442971.1 hypothetical protein [Pseudofrankia sp. BMG5.37]